MVEPISIGIGVAINTLVKHAPDWLHTLGDTLLDKGKKAAIEKGQERWHEYLDEKEHLRHLKLALQNAAERGLTKFQTSEERDRYRGILTILSEPGPHAEALRSEAMRLFTLSDSPNFKALSETYNL